MKTRSEPRSKLRIHGSGFTLVVSVQSNYPKRFRRNILLSLYRHVKTEFAQFSATMLTHDDSSVLDMAKDFTRPVSIHQAVKLSGRRPNEGFSVRVRRLKFGATQKELAKLAGVSRTHLSAVEHGHFIMAPITRAKLDLAFRVLTNRARHRPTIAHAEGGVSTAGVPREKKRRWPSAELKD